MFNFFKLAKFFLYLVPFSVIIVTSSTLFPFIVGKYVFFRTTVGLALIFFLLGLLFPFGDIKYSLQTKERLSLMLKSPLVVSVSIFTFIFLLACFFGVDPKMSFWSNFERGEGGLQILYLGIFFWLLAVLFNEEKDWRKMFWISILAAGLVIFYGVGAHLKYIDAEMQTRIENGFEIKELTGQGGPWYKMFKNFIGGSFKDAGFRFSGSLGNPAYTATYLIFALFYAFYLLITQIKIQTNTDKNRRKFISAAQFFHLREAGLLLSIIIFLVFFWLAATRGAFMGLIAAVLAGFVYLGFSIKKWRQWFLTAMVFVVLAAGTMIYFRDTAFIKAIPGSRILDISFSAQTWQHRTLMWQTAIEGWKERPLLGWGPENFLKIFDKHFPIKYFNPQSGFGAWFDRAHSIYFDYLAETGILGLLSYLGIFAAFYWQFFKKKNSKNDLLNMRQKQTLVADYQLLITKTLLFALPFAYLIQGIVLFEILPLYINLFLFLAFTNYKFKI